MKRIRHCRKWSVAFGMLAACSHPMTAAAMATARIEPPERPLFRSFSSADGLPSDTVYALAMDASGNLWIATLDGLARFDGVKFRVWRHEPTEPGSLAQNNVQAVIVDEHDQVWVGIHNGGLARYRTEQDDFESWRHDPNNPASLSTDWIWAIEPDAEGVWAGGFGGLSHVRADGTMTHLDLSSADSCNNQVLSLAWSQRDGDLWIGTVNGLCRYHPDEGVQNVAWQLAEPGERKFVIRLLIDDELLWVSTINGLHVFPSRTDFTGILPEVPAQLAKARGTQVIREDNETLWYATHHGIRRWHLGSGETAYYPARPGRTLAIQAHHLEDALQDHEGNLWFASVGGGLVQLVPKWRAIRAYLINDEGEDLLPSRSIFQIGDARDGRIWISLSESGGGLIEFDLISGESRRLFADGDGVVTPDSNVLTALRDAAGCIWTSHEDHIARYCEATGDYRRIDQDQDGRSIGRRPWRLSEAPNGDLWVMFGIGGIARIDRDSLHMHFDPLGDARGLPCAGVETVTYDADGGTWIGCDRGILYAGPGQKEVQLTTGVPPVQIDGLDFDRQGRLWAHASDRLLQLEINGGAAEVLSVVDHSQGWPAARASGLFVDDDGVVWLTSMRGLYGYDPRHRRILQLTQDDGLPSAEFLRSINPVRLNDRHFAAVTLAGIVVIDTRRLRENTLPRPTLRWHLADVQEGGRQRTLPTDTSVIRLRHDHRELRLSVRMNSLAKPSAHRYRFRLDPYDSDWIEQIGIPERVIERLPSGVHELRIEAFGSEDQPAINQLRLQFQVDPPPWRQPWAFAIYLAALIALLALLQVAYRRRLQRRHALAMAEERRMWAEQASEAKTRFLASVGHEIRTPMAGLLGMNSLLLDSPLDERQRHYARSVRKAAEHMLTLINDLLDLSRIEAGKLVLEPAPLNLADLLDALCSKTAAAAEGKGLVLSSRIQPGTPLTVHADGKRLLQILINFTSNAIKFTQHGRVRVLLDHDGYRHCFAVDDDGPGLSPQIRGQLFDRYSQDARGRSSGGSGLGLAIAGELALQMNGEVGVDDGEGGGSRFWLRVPLSASGQVASLDPSGLPPLLVVDADAQRGEDLSASLSALGASVTCFDSADVVKNAAAIVLLAADTLGDAEAQLTRNGLSDRSAVLALPLSASMPAPDPRRRYLPGPWQATATLAACIELTGEPAQKASLQAAEIPPVTRLDRLSLLLVEDDPLLREVLTERLSAMGADMHAVDNGLLALAATEGRRFDAILLDLDLPELDGLQFLALLRQRYGAAAPPVIVVTARQHPDDQEQSLAAGACAFYRKPLDEHILARHLRQIIDSSLYRDKGIDSDLGNT